MKSHGLAAATDDTGPIGPVAVSALLFLLAASPLMRGGNRQVALLVLEAAALVFLTAVFIGGTRWPARWSARDLLLAFVFLSPLWLAVVYLLPLPAPLWNAAAGRAQYAQLLSATGIPMQAWLPLSLVPEATTVSLLAGIPLMAAFLAGYAARLRQLRLLFGALVVLAFLEVIFGMLQLAGGTASSLYFDSILRSAIGTFANPNHFANYVALGLAAYIWLAWTNLAEPRRRTPRSQQPTSPRVLAVWIAGGVLLVIGILMSRSRGAALAGLPAAMAATALVLVLGARARSWRTTLLLVMGALLAGMALVGFDVLVARFDLQRMAGDLPLRTIQASSTMEGAAHFWPWGAGWGTYRAVYPRFQPASLVGTGDHAHQDYAEMFFEGGVFAVLLVAAFGWLAITRALVLARAAMRRRALQRQEMAAAICGAGLLGFLVHSFLEFNMHIPANAIAAALLAGVYLRPVDGSAREEDPSDD